MALTRREFNTSGPNWPDQHYTLQREALVAEGLSLVQKQRYFTIWAPRQGGKSTYFELLTLRLRQEGYGVVHVNFEDYQQAPVEEPMRDLQREAEQHWQVTLPIKNFTAWKQVVKDHTDNNWVLIVDEIEGLNREYLQTFLHTIRSLYHSRRNHALKSVIIVGVSNLAGIMQDNTSPFNIADTFTVPYFTKGEVYELLGQHEAETAALGQPQVFAAAVKEKIAYITGGQPGLVNGIAQQLTLRHPEAPELTMAHYYTVENWYVKEALEKNTANIIHKASLYRRLIEELIYLEKPLTFLITDPAISFLYTQGVIAKGPQGEVTFHVPLYKKRLELAFAVKINGEEDQFYLNGFNKSQGFLAKGEFNWPVIMHAFQDYVQRRGFRYFRAKDPATGQHQTLKEAATIYAFEAFIQTLLQPLEGKSYLETHAGLGNSDLVVNVDGRESVIEAKVYRDEWQYEKGLKQIQHYAVSLNANEAIYLVFINSKLTVPAAISQQAETTQTLTNGTPLHIFHINYHTEKDY